jgi:hypothetical protein
MGHGQHPMKGCNRTEGVKIMAYGMKLIALLSAAGALLLPPAAAWGATQLTATSRFDSAGTAFAREGKVKIEIREVHAESKGTGGPRYLAVFVLFEPTSGAFSWQAYDTEKDATASSLNISQFNDENAAFVKDGAIVDFWAIGFSMYIRDYHGRASSMDDAETKALRAESQSIESREYLLGNGRDLLVVSLAAINDDFLFAPMRPVPSIEDPRVTDVLWDVDKQQWIVTLQGRWKAEITLDADYKLVSMKKVE